MKRETVLWFRFTCSYKSQFDALICFSFPKISVTVFMVFSSIEDLCPCFGINHFVVAELGDCLVKLYNNTILFDDS